MIIGIDGTALTIKYPCGTKTYAVELLNSLSQIDKNNSYIIFSPGIVSIPRQQNFSLQITSMPVIPLSRHILFPLLLKKMRVDVLHCLHPYNPALLHHPNLVTTIHDVFLEKIFPAPLHIKYAWQRMKNSVIRRQTVQNSSAFICISKETKKDFDMYKLHLGSSAPSHVVYEGVGQEFAPPDPNVTGPAESYCLCMADFSPRKNIKAILYAFRQIVRTRHNIKIKIVVSSQYARGNIFRLLHEMKDIQTRVEVLANVSSGSLVSLYQNASLFVYPSKYEGFGLPILEAMACGCPVITSATGATREIAGNAASLVDPDNFEDIGRAMLEILTSREKKSRLQINGIRRAKQFSWKKTAIETLTVYNSLL